MSLFKIALLLNLISTSCYTQFKTSPTFNSKQLESTFDTMRAELELAMKNDQEIRIQLEQAEIALGATSEKYHKLIQEMKLVDSANINLVSRIIEKHGWVGINQIGKPANQALFIIVQHADLEYQEKFLPFLVKSVQAGESPCGHLAYLQDRINVRKGKKQKYGSQLEIIGSQYHLSPLQSIDSVNYYRKQCGLDSIENYLELINVNWENEKCYLDSSYCTKKHSFIMLTTISLSGLIIVFIAYLIRKKRLFGPGSLTNR